MKKVLILVMSSEKSPYKEMAETSRITWDSEEINGVHVVYYTGVDKDVDFAEPKFSIYVPEKRELNMAVTERLQNVSKKTEFAFKESLKMRHYDYIMRPNASTYVDKKVLLDYIQDKPETYFGGLVAPTENGGKYMWGVQYIISRDLVELSVKKGFNYSLMDDRALSLVLEDECEFQNARMMTIHAKENGYEYLTYEEGVGGGGFVKDLSELPKGHYAYRCKTDYDRSVDCKVFKELWKSKQS